MTEALSKSLPHEKKLELQKSYKFYSFAIMVILAAALVLVTGIFWAVFPYDPIVLHKDPVPVVQREYARGEYVELLFDYCKTIDSEGLVERFLVSEDVEIRLTETKDIGVKECVDKPVPVKIPDDGTVIVPGRYYLKYNIIYSVTPLKRVILDKFNTESFDIVR